MEERKRVGEIVRRKNMKESRLILYLLDYIDNNNNCGHCIVWLILRMCPQYTPSCMKAMCNASSTWIFNYSLGSYFFTSSHEQRYLLKAIENVDPKSVPSLPKSKNWGKKQHKLTCMCFLKEHKNFYRHGCLFVEKKQYLKEISSFVSWISHII